MVGEGGEGGMDSARIITNEDETFECPECFAELRFQASRDYSKYGMKEEHWVCTNCFETWCVWQGPPPPPKLKRGLLHRLAINIYKRRIGFGRGA